MPLCSTLPALARSALALLVLTLFASSAAGAPSAAPPSRPTVILISIDGLHPDTLRRVAPPTLTRWAAEGAQAEWMQPAYPTLTFPNHYTQVTGLAPDRHGIVHNRMRDAELGPFSLSLRAAVSDGRWWDDAEPLWVTARRAGLRSATLFWPGSEARISGMRPNDWLPYAGDMPNAERVRRVLRWLDRVPSRRPHFITLYFAAVDEAGHAAGPDSPEVDAALREVDEALGSLEQGLRQRGLFDRIDLVVVSDHGMAKADPASARVLDERVALSDAEVVSSGETAGIAPAPGREAEVAAALLGRHDGYECWRREDLPAAWRYGRHPRVPPIVCQADEGVFLATRERIGDGSGIKPGAHGYAPELPSMRATFIARGPGIKAGVRIPAIDAVDVHPLLVHLLGLPPMPRDGRLEATAAALAPVR